jgi:hypothetical protein
MHGRSRGPVKLADGAGFAMNISRVLVAQPVPDHFSTTALQKEAAGRNLLVEWSNIVSPKYDPATLVGVAICTTARADTLAQAFCLANRIQEQRIARGTYLPITIVNCSRETPPSTRADFLRCGCQVISEATPEQIIGVLDTALVDAGRRRRRGITLVIRTGFLPLMSCGGRQQDIRASAYTCFGSGPIFLPPNGTSPHPRTKKR